MLALTICNRSRNRKFASPLAGQYKQIYSLLDLALAKKMVSGLASMIYIANK